MSKWTRAEQVEKAYEVMHGVKPQVYKDIPENESYSTKLIYGGKEIILTEILERGLTKEATLQYAGETFSFASVIAAEEKATSILKGE